MKNVQAISRSSAVQKNLGLPTFNFGQQSKELQSALITRALDPKTAPEVVQFMGKMAQKYQLDMTSRKVWKEAKETLGFAKGDFTQVASA